MGGYQQDPSPEVAGLRGPVVIDKTVRLGLSHTSAHSKGSWTFRPTRAGCAEDRGLQGHSGSFPSKTVHSWAEVYI